MKVKIKKIKGIVRGIYTPYSLEDLYLSDVELINARDVESFIYYRLQEIEKVLGKRKRKEVEKKISRILNKVKIIIEEEPNKIYKYEEIKGQRNIYPAYPKIYTKEQVEKVKEIFDREGERIEAEYEKKAKPISELEKWILNNIQGGGQ